jgi:hypothetical protein
MRTITKFDGKRKEEEKGEKRKTYFGARHENKSIPIFRIFCAFFGLRPLRIQASIKLRSSKGQGLCAPLEAILLFSVGDSVPKEVSSPAALIGIVTTMRLRVLRAYANPVPM